MEVKTSSRALGEREPHPVLYVYALRKERRDENVCDLMTRKKTNIENAEVAQDLLSAEENTNCRRRTFPCPSRDCEMNTELCAASMRAVIFARFAFLIIEAVLNME